MKPSIVIIFLLISNISFGQLKLEDLQIDTTITGFHLAADFQGTIVYTKNGPSDIQTRNPTAFAFTIMENLSAKKAKKQLYKLLSMSIKAGYTISDKIEKDTTLNGNVCYYLSYKETNLQYNYQNFVFNAFVIKDKTAVIFTSGDLDNRRYYDKFKKTFYSIKI